MAFEIKKIGDVCTIRRGASPRPIKDYIAEEGMPWVKISDATSANSRYLYHTDEYIIEKGVPKSVTVEPETLIVSNSATPGLPMIMKIKACVHDGWLVFSEFNGVTRDYLYYKFIDIRRSLVNQANGSVFMNLKTDIVRNFDIMVPPIAVQNKIVNILLALDEKIENNKQINRNLQEQVDAFYKSWFVDFERHGGECPDSWNIATLADIAEITSGKRPPMKQNEKSEDVKIPLIGAASIMGYTNAKLYDSKILVTGRVGTHGVVQRYNEDCWPSDNTLVITTNRYEFVNQILRNIDYQSMNRGSTQPLITQGDLKKTEIVLPTSDILDEFEALACWLMAQYEHNEKESKRLAELRDLLLPKLISGELDVSSIKI